LFHDEGSDPLPSTFHDRAAFRNPFFDNPSLPRETAKFEQKRSKGLVAWNGSSTASGLEVINVVCEPAHGRVHPLRAA
jgi:hypothetical protein